MKRARLHLRACANCGADICHIEGSADWRHWPSLVRRCHMVATPTAEGRVLDVEPSYMADLQKRLMATELRGA